MVNGIVMQNLQYSLNFIMLNIKYLILSDYESQSQEFQLMRRKYYKHAIF